MSLYGQYIAERENKSIIETDKGFVTFYPMNGGLYLEDIYVIPEERHSREASKLADQVAEIALEKGLTKLYGSVVPSANNSTASLRVLLGYGFKLDSCTNNFILFRKELA